MWQEKTVKTEEAIEVVISYVEINATNVSCRRNGLGLTFY